ncbi:MAG: GNAT family N-acetyltransferase [bacterium]|nr:GNAT family N-acetyltransferase [bacterium]
MSNIRIESFSGKGVEPWIDDLARLRISVFRAFPYLYDGSLEYELKYLQTYLLAQDSIVVLAFAGDDVIGASTALPLVEEIEEFQQPFIQCGVELEQIFYLGESVLLPEFRGQGIYKEFFSRREAQALRLGGFRQSVFCAVQRSLEHPLRPADYQPLDLVWERFGYCRQPSWQTMLAWRDLGEAEESEKLMMFWSKVLVEGSY